MTHLQLYDEAGKTLMRWIRENPPEGVTFHQIVSYKDDYSKMYLAVERELYQAYNEKEIDEKTYGDKCEALDEINNEISEILNKKVPQMPPPFDAIMKMFGNNKDDGPGSGFIIFGGKFP